MTEILVTMTATYDTWQWEYDESGDPVSDYPIEGGGFTDPCNPWGGFKVELPHDMNPDEQWFADNVTRVEFHSLGEAARFCVDFPGAVWDWRHDCDPDQDYRTGEYTRVTLHIDEGPHKVEVLNIADRMERVADKRLARRRKLNGGSW